MLAIGARAAAVAALLCSVPATSVADKHRTSIHATTNPELALRVVGAGHTGMVRGVALSPDQRTLVSVGDDLSVRIWSVADSRLLQTVWPAAAASGGGRLYAVEFSPNGEQFIVAGDPPARTGGGNHLYFYRSANGELQRVVTLGDGFVRKLAWLRNGTAIAACGRNPDRLQIVSTNGGAQFDLRLGGPCYALAELGDGTLLVGDGAGAVRRVVHKEGRWTELNSWKTSGVRIGSLSVAPDGRHVAVGFYDRGSDPQSSKVALVNVLSTTDGRVVWTLKVPSQSHGDLRSVAWSADGRRILVGGSVASGRDRFLALQILWPEGKVQELAVGNDSVMDIRALGASEFVIASADTTWSIVRPGDPDRAPSIEHRVVRQTADLRGASNLRLSPDARVVGFTVEDGRVPMEFDLRTRRLGPGTGNLAAPNHVSERLRPERWENERGTMIAGRAVDLGAIDISRAIAIAGDESAAFLGSNLALRRISADGATVWTVALGVETRAVHVSTDGRIVVSALHDGTIRWWRARDGYLLLSLYIHRDGRWVLWTDGGYYDAPPGAESLVGFVRDRENGPGADFFSLGLFREDRNRPDVIDRVLETLDPVAAVEVADAARKSLAARIDDEGVKQALLATSKTQPTTAANPAASANAPPIRDAGRSDLAGTTADLLRMPSLPPLIQLENGRAVRAPDGQLSIAFSIRSTESSATAVGVRVDGRPGDVLQMQLPVTQDGNSKGRVVLRVPRDAARVTLFAQAGDLLSESKEVDIVSPKPEAGAQPGLGRAQSSAARRLFVLAIGVSEYRRSDYSTLLYAAKDARDFAGLLKRRKGALYSAVQVRVLTDAAATRSSVLDALKWIGDETGAADTAIVFIAGHGINDAAGRYHFMTYDADVDLPSSTAVGEADFRRAMTSVRGRVLMFADTCHAGGIIGSGVAAATDFSRMANVLASPASGVVVFASSTRAQESLERQIDGNGLFTKALIEGLDGRADLLGQGQVTHQGLGYFVAQTVIQRTGGRQTPVYVSPMGTTDFPLVATR